MKNETTLDGKKRRRENENEDATINERARTSAERKAIGGRELKKIPGPSSSRALKYPLGG